MARAHRRIETTHTGSLPRAPDLLGLLVARDRGGGSAGEAEPFETVVGNAVREVVRRQVEIGLDRVNDGEAAKLSYSVYVKDRLSGFDGEAPPRPPAADIREFPGFLDRYLADRASNQAVRPVCTGPIAYVGRTDLGRDLANLRQALDAVGRSPADAFVTAASPGVVTQFLPNRHYASHEAYLAALADAMKTEYDAIHRAGFLLQVDCPDLASGRHINHADLDLAGFRRVAALHVEVLNHALRDVPPERMRLHLCWGNYEGPHHRDVPLADIVDVVLRAKPGTLSFEAANPRHAHEWRVWEEVDLPEGKTLMPGVIDSTTNYVEHPELVAERLLRFAHIVGPERVIGATDCGLATFAGSPLVDPEIAWAKLGSLVEGAKLASAEWAGASSDVALAPRTRGANEIRV